jgi:Tfp pilus assembly protein PilX
MNKKLTTNWMRLMLMHRPNEKGFALPIAMGMGLFLILIAMMMMYKSQNDRVSATTQQSTTRGLSAAETGVTRYQDLINKNRAIATYPHAGTTSWANASGIPGLSSCNSNLTNINTLSSTAWQDVDSTDLSKGQYRLRSYAFQPETGTTPVAPGIATLTVEGRVNQNGSGSTATKDVGTSTARLQVKVPIQVGDINNIPIPGLWLTKNDTGNNTIDADVLLNDCDASLSNIKVASGRTKNHTSLTFPALPLKPSQHSPAKPSNNLGAHTGNITLPRSADVSTVEVINGVSSKVYRYNVTSIDLQQGNATMNVRTGDYNPSNGSFNTGQTPIKVYFYLDGNIEKGGDILHGCTTSDGTPINNCKSTDFHIYGYGDSTKQICTNGNNKLEAFIFAPQYTVGAAGAGNGGGFKGTVWTKNWSNNSGCGSNTSNTTVVQNATWSELGLTPSTLPPRLGNISDWKRQEVNEVP